MNLEVITRGEASNPSRPSLLFIHGGYHAAWCWDEFMLPWFAERGWQANALSLRGHGTSDGHQSIARWTLADYADDVDAAIARIARPTILIGHSLGGAIAQINWSRSDQVAGMVLYACSPLAWGSAAFRKLLFGRPFSFVVGQIFGTRSALLRIFDFAFFPPEMPVSKRNEYLSRLGQESPKALAELFNRKQQRRAEGDRRPVLVLAGAGDWSIPLSSHEALAEAFKAELKVCPGAHDLMLDPQWESNARAMDEWLSASFPSSQP